MLDQVEWILLAKKGDKMAFSKLVSANQLYVRRFIAARTNHSQDVDDLAQDAFCVAYKNLRQLKGDVLFRTWVCGIAHNLLRNHERRFNPSRSDESHVLDQLIDKGIGDNLNLVDQEETFEALSRCIAELKVELQDLLDRYYFKNYSIAQLTEYTGEQHSAVTMRMYRIRAALKKCVVNRLGEPNE